MSTGDKRIAQAAAALRVLHAVAPSTPDASAPALEFYAVAHAYIMQVLDVYESEHRQNLALMTVVAQWSQHQIDVRQAQRMLTDILVASVDHRPIMDAIQRADILRRELDDYKGMRAERDALRAELQDLMAERLNGHGR